MHEGRAIGASGWLPLRRLSRRTFLLRCAVGAGAAGVLSACGGGSPAAPSGQSGGAAAPTAAPQATAAVQSITTPAPAAAVAKPEPSPAAAAPAVKTSAEPKGKLVYAWHTTISPSWLDPQENPPQITPYNFAYCLHDALVKHMPGKTFAPSLAESYEVAPDFKSAVFKLRPNIKFHDGTPVTPEDVKFTYENYRGANAKILKDKLAAIELPDNRTIKFTFKEPFLDFLTIYGSPSSGAGWVVPKAYYEKVGKDAFKNAPIGAGPYKFVRQAAGTEIEFEAFTDYWRKVPSIKTIVMRGVPEGATRVAQIQTGEIDVANLIPGELLDTIKRDSKLRLVAVQAGPCWLEPMAFDTPDSPLKDVRVRQAVSLAIDRKAISDAEMGGMAGLEGNWIPSDWPGAIQRPTPEMDVAKSKQLLADAGHPDGFEVSKITPLPPYFSWSERIASQLRAVGIRTQVNQMERGAFYEGLAPGPNHVKGFVMQLSGSPGDAAARVRENAMTGGTFSGLSIPEIDDRMKKYDASVDPAERKKLLDEVQNLILDQYYLVPILRQALPHAVGPRIANEVKDIEGAIPQYVYMGPWEDVQLKDA